MISPGRIKELALKWWEQALKSHILNKPFFPKEIDRIGKVDSKQITRNFEILQQEIENLYTYSKDRVGVGYIVKTTEYTFRRTGTHRLPHSILIESLEDYLHITGREKVWMNFLRNYSQLTQTIPRLREWALNNTAWLTESDIHWHNILKVCEYFIHTARPNLYLRQLPIDVHTKFIEENTGLLRSLLDFLLPGDIRHPEQNAIARRYYLKYDEPLIRIRILDDQLSLLDGITDISIPLSDFERTDWPMDNVLIAENKTNFLALLPLPSSIAIWSGGGFNISYLRNVSWLNKKNIYYWGDIDEHGFQLLHQIRSYYPKTQSVMMNRDTFDTFRQFAVDGQRNKSEKLSLLNDEEAELYQFLQSLESKNRLEQEKISQIYADSILHQIIA